MITQIKHRIIKTLFGQQAAGQYFYKTLLDFEEDLPIFARDHLQLALEDGIDMRGYKQKYVEGFLTHYKVPQDPSLTLKQRIAVYKMGVGYD